MKLELYFTSFLIVFIGLFLILSYDLPFYESSNLLGSGFFPLIITGVLMLLLIYHFIKTLYIYIVNKEKREGNAISYKLIYFILSLIACLFLTNILGMLVSTGLFIFLMLITIERKSFQQSITLSIGFVFVAYLIFDYWLDLIIPKGIFGI